MFDRVPARCKEVASGGVHFGQHLLHVGLVDLARDVVIAGGPKHFRQHGPDLLHRPAYRIAIHGGVHALELVDALGTVDVATFEIEAVETEQGGLLAVDLALHQDHRALVRVVLDIPVPKLVLHHDGHSASIEAGPALLLCHRNSSLAA